jgi:hypothetical protein
MNAPRDGGLAVKVFSFLGLLILTGCATITGGSRDPQVNITSDPPGAAVWVDHEPRGATPAIVELNRKSEHKITVVQPGCEPATATVKRSLNPWVFGNIVLGGLIGVVVDVCTDATYKLSPSEIHFNLKPLAVTSSSETPAGTAPPSGRPSP